MPRHVGLHLINTWESADKQGSVMQGSVMLCWNKETQDAAINARCKRWMAQKDCDFQCGKCGTVHALYAAGSHSVVELADSAIVLKASSL